MSRGKTDDKPIKTRYIMDKYWPLKSGVNQCPAHRELEFMWSMKQVQIRMIKYHIPSMGYEDTVRAMKTLKVLEAL